LTGSAVADGDPRNNDVGSKLFVNQTLVGIANFVSPLAAVSTTYFFNKKGSGFFGGDVGEK
jgi:hypothetical protein